MHRTVRCLLSWACCAFVFASAAFNIRAGNSPRLYAVEASAVVATTPPSIRLQWPADSNATGYTLSRKALNATSWSQLASLPGSATTYTDVNVTTGVAYEYQILKTTSLGYPGSGYVYAGINVPMIEQRGKLILVVDNTHAAALAAELKRLELDLVGDGWSVVRRDVPRTATPPTVKALIKAEYDADPSNVKAVFLFGHVAVPYSGDFFPDGHTDHQGAWPADLYYGDMDGVWTDTTVNRTSASKLPNRNVPGDGKFDQSNLPSDVELQVGRVDLFNMTCYSNKTPSRSELDLLRQYLNKDHKFRHGQLPLPRRGLVCDNFGEMQGEAFAASGWRAFASAFGAENNVQVPGWTFFSTLNSQGYLWAYGTGGGSWYTCNGIGGSDDFATSDIKAVFTMFLGSYFGDWDNESAFLRAPLGSTSYTLASVWAGRPHWFFHHMALGQNIGYSTIISQNNRMGGTYREQNWGTRQVHVALMGDPTLRLHPVIPPSAATVAAGSVGVHLSWKGSSDTNIQGYVLYRASSPTGPFTRISGNNLITGTTFNDASGSTTQTYMVRAVKLEQSASGTYYNPSQGVFATTGTQPAPEPQPAPQPEPEPVPQPDPSPIPVAPSSAKITPINIKALRLTWADNSINESGFKIYRKVNTGSYTLLAIRPAGTTVLTNSSLVVGTTYAYRITAYNDKGESTFSNEASVTWGGTASTPSNTATLIQTDSATAGSWKRIYGSEGNYVIGDSASVPTYVNVQPSGHLGWTWNSTTTDPAALERVGNTTRLAACWYTSSSMSINFGFTDSTSRQVSFYFVDWDKKAREQVVEMVDTATGAVLHTRTLSNFENGIYLVYDLKGSVTMRIRPTAGTATAVLSGFFFGTPRAAATVATPVITPNGGTVAAGQQVSISCATTGATIHYTVDGSTPTTASAVYSGPVTVTSTMTIKARAFLSGMTDSALASAAFTVQAPTSGASAQFLGVNTTRAGTWKGALGSEGYRVVADSQVLPNYAELSSSGASEWIWQYNTSDARATEKAGSGRIASCLYASSSFELDLNLKDGQTRKVSFYCLDWDRGGRSQKVEILDYNTRQVLHTYDLASFAGGAWLEYNLKGRVVVRLTRTGPLNAVLSGLFID